MNLGNDASVTDAFQIKLTWLAGPNSGGTPVIDYRIYYAHEASEYTELVTGVTTTYYTTTVPLVAGENYKFKVQARNAVGYGDLSAEFIIRAARVPDVPTDVTTTINGDFVDIDWSSPYDGGSPLLSYTVLILQDNGVTFSEDLIDCDGSDSTILSNSQCSVPIYTLKASPYSLPWGSSV